MIGQQGFSLTELLIALIVALCLSLMAFQFFHQNERVIRDQTLIMEMQQTARAVASQITDEIRMAGQGVPIYAASFDQAPSEPVAVFLPSSDANRIDFRAGLSNVETASAIAGPSDFSIGLSRSLSVVSGSGFSTGKFVYVSGPISRASWSWLRAELTATGAATLTLIPLNAGGTDTVIHFTAPPTVALEEAVSIHFSNGTIRRATATNTSNPSSPVWSAANEIGKNFTALTFTYYGANGEVLLPSSLSNRTAIVRVRIDLTVQAAGRLSTGNWPTFTLSVQTISRNSRVRNPN